MIEPFAAATAVRRSTDGVYEAEVHEGWDIAGNANGGYLLAIVGRALADATGRPDPVTMTGHFLSPGPPGPVTVSTDLVKAGKRFSTGRATLRAGDRPVLTALGTFGDLDGDDADAGNGSGPPPELVEGHPPELPDPDDCLRVVAGAGMPPPFMDRVEVRLHPDDGQFLSGTPSGRAQVRGWFRLRDGEPIGTVALLCAVDAFPPTAFNARLPVAWTPTVELTAHVRARPEPGWLACSFSTRFVTGGFLEADGEVWDASGRLVAQSRQLALVPRAAPPAPPAAAAGGTSAAAPTAGGR